MLLRLPVPVLGRILRWEWFAEEGAVPGIDAPLTDIFDPAPR
ncbi:hypothetical protein [Nocardia asiatica]